jgi:hypothetical protein
MIGGVCARARGQLNNGVSLTPPTPTKPPRRQRQQGAAAAQQGQRRNMSGLVEKNYYVEVSLRWSLADRRPQTGIP